ncbi:PREDICTED: repulsive guidance molecule A-like, partial [Priapulus caudatus]|uniref:Repulsive guidance molecule A-like n=1 Tax=Priapulus caudatus TaxID=37621 RepID=A0ABM1ESF6_PRICU
MSERSDASDSGLVPDPGVLSANRRRKTGHTATGSWSVMGLLRYHSPGPGPGCLMLLIIILRLSTTYGKSACRFEHCNRQYEPVDIAHNVKRANVLDYCQVLRTYAECIRATARGCRGNIGYHGTAKMVEARNEENNCSYVLSHVDSFASATAPPHPRAVAETTMCNYGAGRVEPLEYVQCALFGDPHLTTFTNEFYTCKVVGAWPLISNEYLSVQATNEAVLPGSSATATTKLTVIVKMHAVCAAEKTYHAQADALPPAFVDGSSASGPDGALYIEEVVAGRHIVIHARFIGATVVIRRVAGAALTLAARMPRELVRTWGAAGLELCVKGCPAGETIDYRSFLGRGG